MTMGEVAARTGLRASALRYYEKAGLLAAPARASGRRVFPPEVLHQLLIICFAKDAGFTLAEIRLLLHGFPQTTAASARWNKLARRKITELEHTIANARAMRRMLQSVMRCRCRKLEECAQVLAAHLGKRSGRRPLVRRAMLYLDDNVPFSPR